MDVLYPVRPGELNNELRFSLRTLEHLEHDQVWIVGHKPKWVTGVGYIPGNFHPHPAAIYHNLLTACENPELSDDIVIMNDDFFITEAVDGIGQWYRSTLQEHLKLPRIRSRPNDWWARSLLTTMVCLQAIGVAEPLSYELHVPMVVNRDKMADTLRRFTHITPENPPQWRSLYGNLHYTSPVPIEDCKTIRAGIIRRPFHSTDDNSWRYFAHKFRTTFPIPSRYETCA